MEIVMINQGPGRDQSQLLSSTLSRRSVLRGALVAGLALPSIGALAGCSADDPSSSYNGRLSMTAWEAYPDQIRSNLKAFTDVSGVNVDLTLIPNVGYVSALQTRLLGGTAIDVFYNFAYASTKYADQGWAAKLNDFEGAEDMIADMFASSRGLYQLQDGRIINAPYFSALYSLFYNKSQVKSVGGAAEPQSKDELYSLSEKLKNSGVKAPYAAYWTKQFCEEYFINYLLADGVTPFDEKGAPVFADDAKTKDVLRWWQAMYQDGLTSKGILTADPGVHVTAMAQGTSSFFELHHYFLKEIRGTKGPQSANVDIAYRSPGTAGTALQIGEVIQMGSGLEGDRARDAWRLLKSYGWKDEAGAYSTFISWAKSAALLAPYPNLFADQEFRSAFPKYYDMDKLKDGFENNSAAVSARVAPWYSTFQTNVGDRIQAMLIGEADVDATVSGLASDATTAAGA
jgi:multiple sugar transport system substrate-binding protein